MPIGDGSVRTLIKDGLITIDPPPAAKAWQAMTVDCHLGVEFFHVKHRGESGARIAIDLAEYDGKKFAQDYWDQIDLIDNSHAMQPGEFVLAYTQERLMIKQPEAGTNEIICAFVEGKSSLARIGLGIHITAPTIHPGFGQKEGGSPIMLEMVNHSRNIIILRPGVAIGQFRFEYVLGDVGSDGAKSFGNGQPGVAKVRPVGV